MRHKIIYVILTIVVLAIIVISIINCQKEDGGLIKIGVLAPLSGAASDTGEYMNNAAILAQEDINSLNNQRVSITIEDSKYEPGAAVSSLYKLIDADDNKIIIGPYSSAEVEAVSPITEKRKIVLMVPGAQSDNISYLGDYVFRLIHNSSQEAKVFARYISENDSSDKIDFLAIRVAITESYLKFFKPIYESSGKDVELIEQYDPKQTDFRSYLLKFKEKDSKSIFLISPAKITATIVKQAKEMGIDARFYALGVESQDIIKIAGTAADGLIYPYSFDVMSTSSSVASFVRAYTERFGMQPEAVAANTYDSIMLTYSCVVKFGYVSDNIKKCLDETSDYSGVSGQFSIDKNGDAVKKIFIKTIIDGKFTKIDL